MQKHNVLTRLGGRWQELGLAQRAMRLTLVGLLVLPQAVAPATITVGGGCTLVDAITNANNDNQSGSTDCVAGSGADTITLGANVTLTSVDNTTPFGLRGLPVISTNVTIDGGFTIARSGATLFSIFAVSPTGMLSLVDTTVSGGYVEGGDRGGGIYNYGTTTLTNSTVSGNYSRRRRRRHLQR